MKRGEPICRASLFMRATENDAVIICLSRYSLLVCAWFDNFKDYLVLTWLQPGPVGNHRRFILLRFSFNLSQSWINLESSAAGP